MCFKRGHRDFIIGSAAPAVKGRNFSRQKQRPPFFRKSAAFRFSLIFSQSRPAAPVPAPCAAFDPLLLAFHMGPGPGEALVLSAPFDQRIERERQPEQIQQHVERAGKAHQCVQRADERHDQARLQEEQAVLAAVFREILRLDRLTALISPHTGILHHRVAVKDHHQAAGKLESKKHITPRRFSGGLSRRTPRTGASWRAGSPALQVVAGGLGAADEA